jgi:hypothetical protein
MIAAPVRRLLTALGACALLGATVLAQDAALSRRARFAPEEDVLYLPRPSALRALSLRHVELAADLVVVRALVYFGGELQQKGDFRWLGNYLETALELDPGWRAPYKWAGVATMYNGRPITNDEVLLSSKFLEMGTRHFPSDWELAFMLGCNYLFELHSDDPAQRAAWQREGGEWIRRAAIVGGAPAWVPLLAATIMHKEGRDEAAVRHLEEVYLTTEDEKTREEVRNRLVSLKARLDFAREARERDAFERAWKSTVPYAPPDFFVAVGAPPPPRLDLRELARDPVLESSSPSTLTPSD